MSSQNSDLPEGFKITELGPLPEEWKVVRLDNITVKTKQVDPRREPACIFKYVDVSGISREQLKITDFREYLGKEAPLRARKVVKAGDIIFATVRPYLKRVAIVPNELDGNRVSTAFCIIRSNQELAEPNYIFQAVTTDDFVRRVSEHQRGSSYPAVTDKDILTQMIPLPSNTEQKAIARILSTIQKAVETQDKIIAAAKELKKSLMRHLFTYGPVPVSEAEKVPLKETEIGPVPEHWEMARLGEMIRKPEYGYTASASSEIVGPKFLRITDIQNSGVAWTSVPYCQCRPTETEKYKLLSGDILIARIGATTGKTFLVEDCPLAIFASYLIRVRCKSSLLPAYLSQFTMTQNYWNQINASKGGRLKQGVNIPVLKSLLMPLPSQAEQQEIIYTLSAVDEKIEAEDKRKVALQGLFKTMLRQLMTGKVRATEMEAQVL